MMIYSCKNCVPPKRHPGCHGHCPEYQNQKAMYDAKKAEYDRKKEIDNGVVSQLSQGVYKATKHRRKGL